MRRDLLDGLAGGVEYRDTKPLVHLPGVADVLLATIQRGIGAAGPALFANTLQTQWVDGQGEDAAANSLLDWLDDCSSLQGTSARWHEVEQAVPDEPLESEFEGALPPGFNPFL